MSGDIAADHQLLSRVEPVFRPGAVSLPGRVAADLLLRDDTF
jgi:hypothetical protein